MNSTLKKIIPARLAHAIWKIKNMQFGNEKLSTSLSDNQVYPDFCIRASLSEKVFSDFKRNKVYRMILEHTTKEQGEVYLNEINKTDKTLLNNIESFKQNDKWGNPEMFNFSGVGTIAPSTLRYIKVLSDIMHLFGKMDGFKICEIGVGYGGQCRIINSIASPAEYTLVDIKPALMLAQCFLDRYVINSVMKYKTMNELEKKNYDLVISNYAFTELPGEIQDVYLKKIILNSQRGYITYNEITPDYFKSYKREDLLAMIPGSRIIEEKPLTHERNCIIVWGDQTK